MHRQITIACDHAPKTDAITLTLDGGSVHVEVHDGVEFASVNLSMESCATLVEWLEGVLGVRFLPPL